MSIRMWDKELRLFWNILSIQYNEAGKLIHFYGFRWKDNKQKEYIDLEMDHNQFELKIQP